MLGFVMRICSEFDDPLVFNSVYYSHVRSHLEYGSVVWFPNQDDQKKKIECAQKKFLAYLFRKFGWFDLIQFAPYEDPNFYTISCCKNALRIQIEVYLVLYILS